MSAGSAEILINVTPRETRVAVIEGGMVQEVHLERASRRGLVGSIYKGRIKRVMPGMQAAFVDLGMDRAAFLHVADLLRPPATEVLGGEDAEAPRAIGELLREGQEVVVQVIKDPIGGKGPRLTTQLSIASRYLVLLPYGRSVGVSARIEDEAERQRLRQTVAALGGERGYIVRTNAEGLGEEALREDLGYLDRVWQAIRERIPGARVGDRLYEEPALALRALRDLVRSGVERVRIDSRETFERAQAFARQFVPELIDRIELYRGERPLFDLYGVEDEISRALKREVPLKSGGHLVIDQTEAMTTIDVNTGGYLGHRNLEETAFRTNLEAAQAVARQLRLRNLGGIIIIDFIDMQDPEHRSQVLRTLERALQRDHARSRVFDISPLGLVQMTRKRTTESLHRQLCETCPTCEGRGYVKSAETVCYEIFRELTRAARSFDTRRLAVLAAPSVVGRILEEEQAAVAELEEFLGRSISFQALDHYAPEIFDVVPL
ncbi:MAG: ribonuclease G [Xanthomonadales bacterium]|nr:ribonuclease G [Xanthomonadales bacterium]